MIKEVQKWYRERTNIEKTGVWLAIYIVFYYIPFGYPMAKEQMRKEEKLWKEYQECLDYKYEYNTNDVCVNPREQ